MTLRTMSRKGGGTMPPVYQVSCLNRPDDGTVEEGTLTLDVGGSARDLQTFGETGAWLGMAAHIRADPALALLRHPGESSYLRFSLLTTWRTQPRPTSLRPNSPLSSTQVMSSGVGVKHVPLGSIPARKLEDHHRKYERKHAEKELKEKVERARRAREEHARAAKESSEDLGGDSGDPGDFYKTLFSDPELMQAFQDPEVAAAFQDITSNPANMAKYQGNPKIKAVINKLAAKFGGPGGMPGGFGGMPGGFGGMPGGFGGMGGGFPGYPPTGGSNSTPGSDDVGLD
uniref:STI1 domain-containing protein n=1 Tax=Timema douglasi TaxID=61478 RepID=A0A7R8VL49_TIMDO|nr:unnamed protein product [Timema douglasi]